MACLVAVGFLGLSAMTDGVSAGKTAAKSRDAARSYVLEGKRRRRGPRILLPIGPIYIYYDYPYYFSRGHYPTHIGGYVYYNPNYYPKYRGRRHKARKD